MENIKIMFLLMLSACVAVSLSEGVNSDTVYRCNDVGWFGSGGCKYMCHCMSVGQCNMRTGECSGDCEEGWFGPSCQYRSLNFSRTGNDWTELTLTDHAQALYWIRYAFNEEVPKDIPRLEYYTLETNTLIPSPITRWAVVDNTTVDVMYEYTNATSKIKLTGPAVQNIKRIYISGGRNVALKQRTNQTSSYKNTPNYYQSSNAVDGEKGELGSTVKYSVAKHCSHTHWTDTDGILTVYFDYAVKFTRIFIVNRLDHIRMHDRLVGFKLYAKSGDSITYQYDDIEEKGKKFYTIIPSTVHEASMLSIKKHATKRYLAICEVEVFGEKECPDGKFGLDCERGCNCADGGSCLPTGGCPNEYDDGVDDDKKDDDDDDTTDKVCVDGKFGPNCERDCNCADGGSCLPTGGCPLGCKDGFKGTDCWTRKCG